MLNGKFRGRDIGSGTDVWKFSEAVRAGDMAQADFTAAESCMSRSRGHCNTMGTASTMACMAEALGMTLPGNAAIPAADARRNRIAQLSGRRAVEMVREGLTIDRVLTRAAFENAILALSAIGEGGRGETGLPRLSQRSPACVRAAQAARRTPSCTCSPSRAASACRWRSRTLTRSARACPASST